MRGKNEPALHAEVIAPDAGGATPVAVFRLIRHGDSIAEGRQAHAILLSLCYQPWLGPGSLNFAIPSDNSR